MNYSQKLAANSCVTIKEYGSHLPSQAIFILLKFMHLHILSTQLSATSFLSPVPKMNQMDSMRRFLAERLDFGFWAVIIFLVNSCAAADYRYETCAPRMCGNLSISYPFYIKGQEEPYCRSNFSEFEVNCINSETPLIYRPENYFVLDTISYKTNTYRMHVHGVANTTDCLPQFSNSTYVSYYETVEALHFLSNCTAQLPEVLLKYKRNQCGGNVSGGWDLVMLWDDKNLEMAKEECITNLVMPVETTPGEENGVVDYLALLKKGVQENWTANDCIGCMESGGRCGFNQSTYLFQCFCPDRPHRVKCQPPLPSWSEEHRREANVTCPSDFQCGSTSLMFPFIDLGHYNCGLCMMDCSSKPFPKIALEYPPGQWLIAKYLGNPNMTLYSELLASLLKNQSCLTFFYQLTLPNSPSISFTTVNTITLFRCKKAQLSFQTLNESFPGFGYYGGCNHDIFYSKDPNLGLPGNRSLGPNCSAIHLPYDKLFPQDNRLDVVDEVFRLLSPEYDLQWHVSEGCNECRSRGGICETDWSKKRHCTIGDGNRLGTGKKRLATILGSVGAALVAVAVVLAIFLICRRKKGIKGPYFLSRNYSKQSSKLDFEEGSVYLGVSLFTYTELREATKNFDASKELGDGGFGTVYYGKLQDGREVAVKRLYEHNFKRLEQFMNEIEILTRLRHPNLVALYGCTSRRSRELLLVYEYIPNGTIADHLHGDRADHKYLTWTHRMSIAIETAEALSYLHASDIIHRDVKTTNILLDHNFCVKVADFGLSRLFPLDVTHVSTAPQGTPGYVDPEYHQCYHLTDKSDVYSFGVVLVELISSMPAVDMSRHRHEINLANLAINRIQRCAFDELIDPSLGYKTDAEVMRMTTSVAELAFQCLQGEKEMRPSMGEVLQTLKDIQSFKQTSVQTVQSIEEVKDNVNVFSPESEDRVLLKNAKFPSSPVSVTHLWVSSSTSASTNSN